MRAREDLAGRTFGRLKVLYYTRSNGKGPLYLCRCQCGTEKEIRGSDFTVGDTKSCGCLRRDKAHEMAVKKHDARIAKLAETRHVREAAGEKLTARNERILLAQWSGQPYSVIAKEFGVVPGRVAYIVRQVRNSERGQALLKEWTTARQDIEAMLKPFIGRTVDAALICEVKDALRGAITP